MRNWMSLAFVLLSVILEAQSVYKTMLRLPDTGQTTSYTTTFGEDADYTIHPPFYELNGDGTVTDTVTGLMWQKADGGEMTIESASSYCDSLSLGGYTDWRLPDCHELFSILNQGKVNPAIDTTYFSKTQAEYWWSNQRQVNDSNKVWVTNAGGGVGNHPKSETLSAGGSKRFHVRAVRDITSAPLLPNHFTLNADNTVTDLITDLTWQSFPFTDSLSWENALVLADTLSYAGFTDWRLPNIKELQSINDEKLINPSVNQSFFSGINISRYWSSTSLPNQTGKAWFLDTHFGITTYADKTSGQKVLCVRDYNLTTGVKDKELTSGSSVIYPNPSHGLFTVKSDKPIKSIRVYNGFGEEILMALPEQKTFEFHIPANGIYVVKLYDDDEIRVRNIIVIQ